MKTTPRLQQLNFLLKKMDKIHLRDAAEILNVSEMTIRRDLNNSEGDIILLGGYLVKSPDSNQHNSYLLFEQENKNIAEKMHIGKLAAAQIKENDIVFFDCGTTTPFIASQIPRTLKFTAICCSINTFLILQEHPYCELILSGGKYSGQSSSFSSLSNTNELDQVCTTKAFISTAGVHPKKGITCFSFEEVKNKLKAMQKTNETFLVFDHSKVNQVKQAYIGDITQFDKIITNKKLPENFPTNNLNLIF